MLLLELFGHAPSRCSWPVGANCSLRAQQQSDINAHKASIPPWSGHFFSPLSTTSGSAWKAHLRYVLAQRSVHQPLRLSSSSAGTIAAQRQRGSTVRKARLHGATRLLPGPVPSADCPPKLELGGCASRRGAWRPQVPASRTSVPRGLPKPAPSFAELFAPRIGSGRGGLSGSAGQPIPPFRPGAALPPAAGTSCRRRPSLHPPALNEPCESPPPVLCRAYKLGKKRWSYNQVELVLREQGSERRAAIRQASHDADAPLPAGCQASTTLPCCRRGVRMHRMRGAEGARAATGHNLLNRALVPPAPRSSAGLGGGLQCAAELGAQTARAHLSRPQQPPACARQR